MANKIKIMVITGGGSGMGLATARMAAEAGYGVVLVGRTMAKIQKAASELEGVAPVVSAFAADVTDRAKIFELAAHAAALGEVAAVIHAAGLSPHMGDAETIIRGNALGSVNVNDAFLEVIAPGGCVIDTSSMSAYIAPALVMPRGAYGLARTDPERFVKKLVGRSNLAPKDSRPGLAYSISKDFVVWLAQADAARFGEKGARVLSVTPGNFETPMGQLESGEGEEFLKYNAIKRFGKPEEIAALYMALVDPRLGYLTGADIIVDGGCIAGYRNK